MAPKPSQVPAEGRASARPDEPVEAFENPRGTLVIVLLFGLVFAVGWLAMYFWVFLGRGALHS